MKEFPVQVLLMMLLVAAIAVPLAASPSAAQTSQEPDPTETAPENNWSVGGEVFFTSKYMWRGQRLTDAWNMQPAGFIGYKGFTFLLWGTLDLTQIHEGDGYYLPENPEDPGGGHHGLQGKFSEVDLDFSYEHEAGPVTLTGGSTVFIYPYRSHELPTTVEVYGGLAANSLPLSPGVVFYFDVDESMENGNGYTYVAFKASHSFEFSHRVLTGLDLEAAFGLADTGFSEFCYGVTKSGAHDLALTATLPLHLSDHLGIALVGSYNGLLGGFRDYQYLPTPAVYRGEDVSPRDLADTWWGGIQLVFE